MVAAHTHAQHLQFIAQLGDEYATSIEAAIAKRTQTHVLLRMEHPVFARWHGSTPIGKAPAPMPIVVPRTLPLRSRGMLPAPGSVLAAFISWLGFDTDAGCGCRNYQALMNKWGWLGCWRRRGEIVARLVDQGKRQRLAVGSVHSLIATAARLAWWRVVSAGRAGWHEVSSIAIRWAIDGSSKPA